MKSNSPHNPLYDTIIRLIILLLIIGWCLLIMYPFVSIILWSLILAIAIYPLHTTVSAKLGGRPKLASFIIVFSILAIVILPVGLLIGSLFDEVKALKVSYDSGTLVIPVPPEKVKEWPVIGSTVYGIWDNANRDLMQVVTKYQDPLLKVGATIGQGILSAAGGVIQIIAALIIAGILLIVGSAGENIRKFFRKVAGDRGDEFADTTMKTVGNVVKGIIGVALILALLHGIFFMLAGVPYAGIWTLFVFVLAVLQIPLFFVTAPVVIYMFATKDVVPAIIWTAVLLVIGLADNFLKPILLGKGAPVPMLVIFIGVIGGFLLSGFIGLFTGAIIMSIGYKLFVTWVDSPPAEPEQ